MPTLRYLSTLLALLPAALATSADRIPVIDNPAPSFPPELFAQSVNHGRALVVCTIGDEGSVLDVWTLETNHLAFSEAAVEALRSWRYAPANTSEGSVMPWPRIDVVAFDFSRSGQITTKTHREAMAAAFPTPHPPSRQLENLPLLPAARLSRLQGNLPTPPPATPAGEVIVEFLVDAQGQVYLPVAVQAQQPAHARAAVAAVRAWRFAALPADITAPAVRVRWGFRFPARS